MLHGFGITWMWDREIKADLASVKLDSLIAKAEVDIAANRVREIDRVFRKP